MEYRQGHWYVQRYTTKDRLWFAVKCAVEPRFGYEYAERGDDFDTWREAFDYALRDGEAAE